MNISELKKMLKHSTAVLIMDNGEPSYVVVDYKSYKDLLEKTEGDSSVKEPRFVAQPVVSPAVNQSSDMELLERINKDILALKEQIEEEEKGLGI
ncbi:MAG: hypothetical protein KBC81_00480 [Candidatus Pacebacteria bacterium]|nr:hypothetical protein [Candidatus Paceibacterota bacterium]